MDAARSSWASRKGAVWMPQVTSTDGEEPEPPAQRMPPWVETVVAVATPVSLFLGPAFGHWVDHCVLSGTSQECPAETRSHVPDRAPDR